MPALEDTLTLVEVRANLTPQKIQAENITEFDAACKHARSLAKVWRLETLSELKGQAQLIGDSHEKKIAPAPLTS